MMNWKNTLLLVSLLVSTLLFSVDGCTNPEETFDCTTCYADYPDGSSDQQAACNASEEESFKEEHKDAVVICY